MDKPVSRLIPAALMLAVTAGAWLPGAAVGQPRHEGRGMAPMIQVQGEGEARARPDEAVVQVGVETRNESAAQAMAGNADTARRLLETLKSHGVDDARVQTGSLSLTTDYRPQQEGGQPEPAGYVASQILSVTVQPVDDLGPVLDALVAAGANQIHGIQFRVADDSALLDQARDAAIADARSRAERYAQAAGASVGPVIRIIEGGSSGPGPMPMMRMMASEAAMGTPIAAGETTVGVTVEVTYGLKRPE